MSALAKAPLQDPDPNFASYADAASGQYVVTLVQSAYTVPPPPSDPNGSNTNGAMTSPTVTDTGDDLATDYGATVLDSYDDMGSFVCAMDETTARAMSHDGRVACVESNAFVYGCGSIANPGYGLDRLDQRPAVNPNGSAPNNLFTWSNDGSGVTAFVVDTGIYAQCTDFSSTQVKAGWPNATDYYTGPSDPTNGFYGLPRSSDDDSNLGHGTPVAGVLGGQTCGVAHGVRLVAVKVLGSNDKGSIASVVAGLQYVYRQMSDKRQPNHPSGPVVVNLSLAFQNAKPSTINSSLRTAVDALIGLKATVVVAAGNAKNDAAYACPANIPELITVGGTDSGDNLATFNVPGAPASNSGSVVDLYAPSYYVSAYTLYKPTNGPETSQPGTWLGTSFASPYVAGVAAQYLQGHPTATPAAVQSWITTNATTPSNSATGAMHLPTWAAPGTLNRILYTNL